jgi:hypothetical protein
MQEELQKKTVKELQQDLIKLGMSEEDVGAFKTKATLIATINTLSATKKIEEEPKRVATLEESPNPVEEKEIGIQYAEKRKRMKDHLLAQPKVSILIPLEPGEKVGVVEWRTDKNGEEYQLHISGAIESVQINGFKFFIPKGRYYEVPKQIAEVVSQSQQQVLEAGQEFSIDRIDPNTGRPMRDIL